MDGLVIVQAGGTGSGKTTNTKKILETFKGSKPFYIYDIDGEYTDFYRAPYEQLEKFFDRVVKLKNSVVVFEEAFLFFQHGNAETDLREMIITARRRQNIIIFNFHQLRQIPIYILAYTNFLIIKKTVGDSVKKFKDAEMNNICEAWERVRISNDYFISESINLRPKVI